MKTGPVYGQQLVDPGRTGLEPVDLRLPLTDRWDLGVTARSAPAQEPCLWLLASAHQAALQGPSVTYFVDWKQRAVSRSADYLEWVALSPGSTLVDNGNAFEFLRRPHFWPTGSVLAPGYVLGARVTKTEFDVLLQHEGLLGPLDTELWRFPWHYPAQQPYTKGVLQWQRSGSASGSAFGPGGSVVVVLDDKLVVLDEAGHVEREIPGRFLAGRVSIDKHGTIYAFERSNGSTRLVMLAGKQRSSVDLGAVEPLQPPMPLPGGAVRVIAKTGVLGIDAGVVRWRWRAAKQSKPPFRFHSYSWPDNDAKRKWGVWLPESGLPLATATRNGYLVVRDRRRVVALDEHGKVVWQAKMPGPIVSNPVITAEGGVCVVWWRNLNTLTCLLPAAASP